MVAFFEGLYGHCDALLENVSTDLLRSEVRLATTGQVMQVCLLDYVYWYWGDFFEMSFQMIRITMRRDFRGPGREPRTIFSSCPTLCPWASEIFWRAALLRVRAKHKLFERWN